VSIIVVRELARIDATAFEIQTYKKIGDICERKTIGYVFQDMSVGSGTELLTMKMFCLR
jgi:hypothetical protein